MSASGPSKADGLGTPAVAVILVLGTALSLLLALDLRRQQETEVALQTLTRAQAIARVAEAEVNRLYSDIQRRASFWSESPQSPSKARPMQILMEENPSLFALAYSATAEREFESLEVEELLRNWQSSSPPVDAILGPATLSDGRRVLGANLRASFGPNDPVLVFVVYEPKRLLGTVLTEVAGDHAFALDLDGAPLLASDSIRPPDELSRHARHVAITPALGEPWSISVWPTPAAIPASYVRGPIVALIAGVIATSLVAGVLHLGTLAWRRKRLLEDSQLELARQIDEMHRTESAQQELSEELEAHVAERTLELNETIAELQTFIYSVSHDLRSPLGAVMNFTAIFAEDYAGRLDETQAEYLDRIGTSAASALSLMDALLSYSHSGRTELRRIHLQVKRLVGELCEEAIAARREEIVDVKIGDLPDVHADESMLRFIFANLISNACKFVKPGETASLEIGGHSEATETVYFVRDSGIGFDPRFEQKLFKAFERLHRTGQFEGHGVGLAIAARMVRRHGGRIWAQGAPEKGATFYFSIPTGWDGGSGTRPA